MYLDSSENILIFSGAGVSTMSGIPDFRGTGGLYTTGIYGGHSPIEILSEKMFIRNKPLFWKYYFENMNFVDKFPSEPHYFASDLQYDERLVGVITQNIDRMYQMAGVDNVVNIHGLSDEFYCMKCKRGYSLDELVLNSSDVPVSTCCHFGIKPNVVLYGESFSTSLLNEYRRLMDAADTLIVMGTGLDIGFHRDEIIRFNGKVINVNNRPVELSSWAGSRDWDLEVIDDFNNIFQ